MSAAQKLLELLSRRMHSERSALPEGSRLHLPVIHIIATIRVSRVLIPERCQPEVAQTVFLVYYRCFRVSTVLLFRKFTTDYLFTLYFEFKLYCRWELVGKHFELWLDRLRRKLCWRRDLFLRRRLVNFGLFGISPHPRDFGDCFCLFNFLLRLLGRLLLLCLLGRNSLCYNFSFYGSLG